MKELDFLEKLMTKAKVKSINKENNTITISLFTIQDVLSLSVFNYDLFLKFLNENDLNEMIYLCEDFYSTYIIKLYASDYIFILKSLFSKLILKSVETKTFKEIISQFDDFGEEFVVKFVNEWNEEVHTFTVGLN